MKIEVVESGWPSSIREINDLPLKEKTAIYRSLLPFWLLEQYNIDRQSLEVEGHQAVEIRCTSGTRSLEILVRRHPADFDPMLYLHMVDTMSNQLLVLLVIINDLDAPRFNIDRDQQGNNTQLGMSGRNIPAELAAMRAGLAPGQVRAGLRVFKKVIPLFESFVEKMGHQMFLIEPMTYHNAILFERYGFNYLRGLQEMKRIHTEFQPGGDIYDRLTPENPFRQPEAFESVRGRSWAIHDGVLGHPFTGFQMYKFVHKAAQISTFPNAKW